MACAGVDRLYTQFFQDFGSDEVRCRHASILDGGFGGQRCGAWLECIQGTGVAALAQGEVDEIGLTAIFRIVADYTPGGDDRSRRKNGGSGNRRFSNRKSPNNYPYHPKKSPQYVVFATATLTPIASVAGSEIRREYGSTLARTPGVPEVYLSYSLARSSASQLIRILLHRHAHQLTPRPNPGLLKQALQNRLHVALRDL